MLSMVVFLPLCAFLFVGATGKYLSARMSEIVTSGSMVICAMLSWHLFMEHSLRGAAAYTEILFSWLDSAGVDAHWALHLDSLTAMMLVVITTISALVHIYSIGYMHEDKSRPRFFAYLSFFTFMMLVLVTGDNLLQLFFGWEGVGLASYLLIGFWYEKPSANRASLKAFIVNRVGDGGFLLGILLLFTLVHSVQFSVISTHVEEICRKTIMLGNVQIEGQTAITLSCLLLLLGAMAKSAQFFLHVWLPDAMEGPTPVSALIHAATMVTAGIFMIARMSFLFDHSAFALDVIIVVGSITAFFAASVGMVQNDIKRIIAFSTCSQLGYMFVALGLGAYSAALFHLFTHAFFKALLFLGAGSVIHAVSGEQDIRRLGGLAHYIPATYAMMLVGTLSLTGFGIPDTYIGTAGFFSKDAIIEASFISYSCVGKIAFWTLVIAALMTSFYSWRLVFLTFHGRLRAPADIKHHLHESGWSMLFPLFLLAIGALFSGVLFEPYFLGEAKNSFWQSSIVVHSSTQIFEHVSVLPLWVRYSSFFAMLLGFFIALFFYIIAPFIPRLLGKIFSPLYGFLLDRWYFDEIYDWLFVKTSFVLGWFFLKKCDVEVIDHFGPNGVAACVVALAQKVSRFQTGYIYHYAFIMLLGVASLITWFTVRGIF